MNAREVRLGGFLLKATEFQRPPFAVHVCLHYIYIYIIVILSSRAIRYTENTRYDDMSLRT